MGSADVIARVGERNVRVRGAWVGEDWDWGLETGVWGCGLGVTLADDWEGRDGEGWFKRGAGARADGESARRATLSRPAPFFAFWRERGCWSRSRNLGL